MKVIGIPAAHIPLVEARIRPFLDEFTNRGQVTVADLLNDLTHKRRQCWVVFSGGKIGAVALTQIFDDRIKTCRITHLTGEGLQEWQDAFTEVERWAKSLGCARIEALARPGYERIGKRYGLQKTHVMLEKDLSDGV